MHWCLVVAAAMLLHSFQTTRKQPPFLVGRNERDDAWTPSSAANNGVAVWQKAGAGKRLQGHDDCDAELRVVTGGE